jgi:hypothetical protein
MRGFEIIHNMLELVFTSPYPPTPTTDVAFVFDESQFPGKSTSITGKADLICQRFSAVTAG